MTFLDELPAAISRVADAAGPSVVGIGSHIRGAGVVIGEGRVLTNVHNHRGDEVTVSFPGGRSVRGRVAGTDLDGDLAVIDVDTAGAPPITWATQAAAIGTVVFGIAATAGGGTRVTVGTVSALERAFRGPGGRRIGGSIEHTAPLAPGSSGGPIVDAEGRMVGIDTNRLGDGFYLAIPADDTLRARVDALARGESAQRRRLGIAVAPARVARRLRRSVGLPERDGLLVRGVEEGGPAAEAGIREGDLVVAIDGRPVIDADTLLEALSIGTPPFRVTVVRGVEELDVEVAATA